MDATKERGFFCIVLYDFSKEHILVFLFERIVVPSFLHDIATAPL